MIYRSGERLHSSVVRAACAVMRRRWRGLDPEEVYEYLRLVADEIDRLQRETATAHAQAERASQGLRQWQARHIGCKFADPPDPLSPPHPRPVTGRRAVDSAEQDQPPRNGGHW
jgi:DivIVA domain-containing protein